MNKFIIFGVLLAILAFGAFDVAWATHTVTGTTPSSFKQEATDTVKDVTIILGGTVVTPAASPTMSFKKGAIILSVSIDPSYNPNAPSPVPVKITIPAVGVAIGKYTVEFCYDPPGPPAGSHCASLANAFEITLASGPAPGPSGGGFVEDVPTQFGPIPEGPQTGGEFVTVIEAITDWIFIILLVMAVIFILLAAFQFISGGGDPKAVAEARTKLIWAAVGIAVALLARGIPTAIGSLFV